MENFNSNNTTPTTTFSHFGKNKLLFANHSWYGVHKSREDWVFISNIHVKHTDVGGCVTWNPLYEISYQRTGRGYIRGDIKGWKLYLTKEGKYADGDGSVTIEGGWYHSFLSALSAARLNYLDLVLDEGEYKVLDKTFMIFNKNVGVAHYSESWCVETFFEEIPESQKYPQLKNFKTAYRYDIYNRRPVYGDETVFDNYEAPQIVNALLDCDYKYAFDLIGYNRLGMTSEDRALISLASVYIDTPYWPYPDEPQYGYPIQIKAYDTIQKAIATAKRLYHVD